MDLYFTIISFIMGTIFGSFYNVCIYRIPEKLSVANPPSHCYNCQTRLKPIDLIPILSWLSLKGKCRYCGIKVSSRYATVELLTGILFALTYIAFGYNFKTIYYMLLVSLLIIITFIDIDHFIIPDELVIAGSIIAIAVNLLGYGTGFMDGLNKQDSIDKMIAWLEENKCGTKKINYRIREWIFARQRYWGEPIPVVHMEDGDIICLSDEQLPLVLPDLTDYKAHGGESPLSNAKDWVKTEIDGKVGMRETCTMPGSAGSSWYFLRYINPNNDKELCDAELLKHWMPVDLYVGGPEHAVGHLLYSRMWNNYLFDKGVVYTKEPFQKLVHQGMILGENGIKMGKRFPKYCINPLDVINEYGADTLRMYEMFMGPLEADKPWNSRGVEGTRKFLERIFRVFDSGKVTATENKNLEKVYHQTVKKVTEDFEKLSFNTAISQMMIFINAVYKEETLPTEYAEGFVKLLSPVCPFLAEELWSMLGHDNTIAYEAWPTYDEAKLVEDEIEVPVQINGKVRAVLKVAKDATAEDLEKVAFESEEVKKFIDGKEVVKKIYVPGKIYTIVIK